MIQCSLCNSSNRDTAKFCAVCAAPLILAQRYQLLRIIGQGGMGRIYLARDLRLTGKTWAIKEMSDAAIANSAQKQQAIQGFQHESQMLAKLNHPNILKVVDFFQQGNKHYIVTDFVDGSTLQDLLTARGRAFTEAEVRPWLEQLCSALSYLHTCQPPIIYRDLKPANIMIDRNGHVRLIDFGIARYFQPGKAGDTTLLGTPGYAAPEQFGQSQTDVRSDIYALGVTLYQLLTNCDPAQTPYRLAHIRTLAPGTSAQMEQIVTRAMTGRPQDRWQNIAELRVALHPGVPAPPAPAIPMPSGQLGPARLPNRPTTKLLMAAASLSNEQLAVVLGAIILAVIVGVWTLGPVFERELPFLFYNIPLFILAGPMAYAAVRRPWVALAIHISVTSVGWMTWWLRTGSLPDNLATFAWGVLLSGLAVEVGMRVWPRLAWSRSQDAWQQEIAWFGAVAAVSWFLFHSLLPGQFTFMPLPIWIGAAAMGASGWFLGDLINQWLYLRKSGFHRPARP